MNRYLLGGLFLLVFFEGYCQSTFNQQYHFGGIAAIGNGIYVTDSCYYFSGLVVDTISDGIYDGLVVGKLNNNGNLDTYTLHLDSTLDYENWKTPFLFEDNHFVSVGFGIDSLYYLYWLALDETGQILSEQKHRSPFSTSDDWFIQPQDVQYDRETKRYFIVNNVGYYLPNGLYDGQFSLLCLDSLGNNLWQTVYGNSWMDNINCITQTVDNEVILGGLHANYNLTSLNQVYQTRVITVDTAGQIQWTWTSPNETQQGANDIIAEEDGSLIVISGRGFLEYVNVQTNIMLWDRGLIFKLNAEQQVEWETEFTEPDPTFENRLNKLVPAIDETGYVGAGQMRLWLNDENASLLGWLVKVSPQGDSLWSRKLLYYDQTDSIEYEHHVHDLQSTPDGGYLLSGYTLDREGNQPAPRQRAWLLKVDSEGCLIPNCGLVDTQEPDEAEGPALLLYPNPADEYLNIYLGDSGSESWTFLLYDNAGRQLVSYPARTGHTTYMIPVSEFAAGVYHLQVIDAAGQRRSSYQWVKG